MTFFFLRERVFVKLWVEVDRAVFYLTLLRVDSSCNLVTLGGRRDPRYFSWRPVVRAIDARDATAWNGNRPKIARAALWVGVAWIQYFLFLRSVPPSTFLSRSLSLARPLLGGEEGAEGSPLLRTSPREDLVILVPDFIFGRCWVSDPQPVPPSSETPPMADPVEGDSAWGPRTSRFDLLFDQPRSCTRQLHSVPYFDSGVHVVPQNFAVGLAPSRYGRIPASGFIFIFTGGLFTRRVPYFCFENSS